MRRIALDHGASRDDRRVSVGARAARGALRTRDRDALEDLIRALTPERAQIADAMLWCVEHAASAKEIADCLYESLTLDETPLHKKVKIQPNSYKGIPWGTQKIIPLIEVAPCTKHRTEVRKHDRVFP